MPLLRKDIAGCTASYVVVGVGNASAVYLSANAQRISLQIFPANAVRASFRFNAAAVLDEHFTIQAAGESIIMDMTGFPLLVDKVCNAIASVVGPTNFGGVQIVRPT